MKGRKKKGKILVLTVALIMCLTTMSFIPQVSADLSIESGYNPDAELKAAVRYKSFDNGGDREVYLGVPDLGVGSNRVETDYSWTTNHYLKFDYHMRDNTDNLYTTVDGNDPLLTYSVGPLSDLDYIQIDVVSRNSGSVSFENVFLTYETGGESLGTFTSNTEGWKTWRITGVDVTTGFSIEGTLTLSGSQPGGELSKVQISVGTLPGCCPEVWVDDDADSSWYDYCHVDSIQTGIDHVCEGGTVYVLEGFYFPSTTIMVDKPVTILGPYAGVDPRPFNSSIRTPGDVSEAIVSSNGFLDTIFYIAADEVTIDGLEIVDGTGDLIYSNSPAVSNIVVKDCIIHQSSGDEGIQLKNCFEGVIYRNYIFDVAQDGANFGYSTNCVISSNEITTSDSDNAAIYVYDSSDVTIEKNYVHGTTAANGIELYTNEGDINIYNNLVVDNEWMIKSRHHAYSGNAILGYKYTKTGYFVNIIHNTLSNNKVSSSSPYHANEIGFGNGIGINTVKNYNGLQYDGYLYIKNNIISDNGLPGYGYGLITKEYYGCDGPSPSNCFIEYNDVFNNGDGICLGTFCPIETTTNIFEYPLFESIGSNYQLQSSSPCIDTAEDLGIEDDIINNPRDTNPDMGAYEFLLSCEPVVWVDDDFDSGTSGWQIDHFNTVQDGVDAVCPGGTVHVYDGEYVEDVSISKSLSLLSVNGKQNTKIIGQSTGYTGAVTITSGVCEVTIGQKNHGFQICGAGQAGLYFESDVSDVTIIDNRIAASSTADPIKDALLTAGGQIDHEIRDNLFVGRVYVNGQTSVSVSSMNVDFISNIFSGQLQNGIALGQEATSSVIRNNVFTVSSTYGVLELWESASVYANRFRNDLSEDAFHIVDHTQSMLMYPLLEANTFTQAVVVNHSGNLLHTIFSDVQGGVNAAFSFDTVMVYNGEYNEEVIVDKGLTAMGLERSLDVYQTNDIQQVWSGNPDTTLQQLNAELVVSIDYQKDMTRFTAVAPDDYQTDDLMTFAFDLDCDKIADFQIQWDGSWKYKEVVGGSWQNSWSAVPSSYNVGKNARIYWLEIPTDELGSLFKFGVDSNGLNHGEGQTFYSADPAHLWYNGQNYVSSDYYLVHVVEPDRAVISQGTVHVEADNVVWQNFTIAPAAASGMYSTSELVEANTNDLYLVQDYPCIYDNPLFVDVTTTDAFVIVEVTVPVGFVDGSQDNVAIPFDTDNDGMADFQLSYHANVNDQYPGEHWGYQEVIGGSWSAWESVPVEFITAESFDNNQFSVAIPIDRLGNNNGDATDDYGLGYRFGVSGWYAGMGTQGVINPGANIQFNFPSDFSWGSGWVNSEDYYDSVPDGQIRGIYLHADHTGHQILDNFFFGPGINVVSRGLLFGYNLNQVTITNNQFCQWLSGSYINPSDNLVFTDNEFIENSVGIGSDGINNVLIEYNNFTDNTVEGWGYSDNGNSGGNSLVAYYNNFVNNPYGIANYDTTDIINGTCNWWNDVTGPSDYGPGGGDAVTDNVIYEPWLTDVSPDGDCNGYDQEAPIANADGPYSGSISDTVTLDGSSSFDSDGFIVNYEWIVDSVSVYSGASPIFDLDLSGYAAGSYTVELIVTDDDALMDNDTSDLTVNLIAPVADANGPYHKDFDDSTVHFDGSASFDEDGYIVSYEWDFGDGSVGSGAQPIHDYEQTTGTILVTLTVTDNDGLTDSDTTTVTFHGNDEFPPIIQLINPRGGELFSEMETVKWFAVDDTLRGDDLPIRLYYSKNGVHWMRLTNEPLCNNIDIDHGCYEWDTTQLSDGSYYLRAEVIGTGGSNRDTSDAFTIDNENMGILVSHVMIEDISIDSTNWVKNGDDVIISASITGPFASELTYRNITANLSHFGRSNNARPDEYNGFIAKWMLSDVDCVVENGELQIPIFVDGKQKGIGKITSDNRPPDVLMMKPSKGLYFFNVRAFPFGNTIIIGGVDVELDINDNFEIKNVEFIVDDVSLSTVEYEPFSWRMNIRTLGGTHMLKAIVSDQAGNINATIQEFTMFNLFGDLW